MRTYRRLHVHLKNRDRDELDRVLNGGLQPVRVVLRSLTLYQLQHGKSISEVASNVHLTAKAVREIGWRYEESGLERALYDKQRPGAQHLLDTKQRQRIIAMVCSDPPEGRARWTVRLITEEAVNVNWCPRWGGKPSVFFSSATTSNRGGKKMWSVPELNEEYLARMEDILETYEKPYDPEQPVFV